MQILYDMKDFLETLTFVDFVFFFAVIVLLILIITLIYFIKINEEVLNESKSKSELELINEAILKDNESLTNNFVSFEKEQEEKAIISYDELIKKNNNCTISYSEEKEIDGLLVKKIETSSDYNENIVVPDTSSVRVISYQKEEEFLKALKNLKSMLS